MKKKPGITVVLEQELLPDGHFLIVSRKGDHYHYGVYCLETVRFEVVDPAQALAFATLSPNDTLTLTGWKK
jgi:hypothetical protein